MTVVIVILSSVYIENHESCHKLANHMIMSAQLEAQKQASCFIDDFNKLA